MGTSQSKEDKFPDVEAMGYILDARRTTEELFSWIDYIVKIIHDHVDDLDFSYIDLAAVLTIKEALLERKT